MATYKSRRGKIKIAANPIPRSVEEEWFREKALRRAGLSVSCVPTKVNKPCILSPLALLIQRMKSTRNVTDTNKEESIEHQHRGELRESSNFTSEQFHTAPSKRYQASHGTFHGQSSDGEYDNPIESFSQKENDQYPTAPSKQHQCSHGTSQEQSSDEECNNPIERFSQKENVQYHTAPSKGYQASHGTFHGQSSDEECDNPIERFSQKENVQYHTAPSKDHLASHSTSQGQRSLGNSDKSTVNNDNLNTEELQSSDEEFDNPIERFSQKENDNYPTVPSKGHQSSHGTSQGQRSLGNSDKSTVNADNLNTEELQSSDEEFDNPIERFSQKENVHHHTSPSKTSKADTLKGVHGKKLQSRKKLVKPVKEFVLLNWIIKPLDLCNGIAVEGQRSDINAEPLWHSSKIVERVEDKTVKTATGSTYKLVGNIDTPFVLEEGFTKFVAKKFQTGFPANWETIIANFYKRKAIGVRKQNKTFAASKTKPSPIISKRSSASKTKPSPIISKRSSAPCSSNFGIPRAVELDDLPKTRSGRAVKPVLAWYAGQRVRVHRQSGRVEITAIESPCLDMSFDNIAERQINHSICYNPTRIDFKKMLESCKESDNSEVKKNKHQQLRKKRTAKPSHCEIISIISDSESPTKPDKNIKKTELKMDIKCREHGQKQTVKSIDLDPRSESDNSDSESEHKPVTYDGSSECSDHEIIEKGKPKRKISIPSRLGIHQQTRLRDKVATGKQTNTKVPTGKQANTKVTTGKQTNTKVTTGKQANTKMATGKQANTKVPTGKQANTKVPTGKQENTKVPTGKQTNTKVPTGKQTNTKVPTGKQTNTKVPTGKQTNTKVATGKQTNTKAEISPTKPGTRSSKRQKKIEISPPKSGTQTSNRLKKVEKSPPRSGIRNSNRQKKQINYAEVDIREGADCKDDKSNPEQTEKGEKDAPMKKVLSPAPSTDYSHPWSKKESDTLYKAVRTYSPDNPEFWDLVANSLPKRSVEECQDFYYRAAPETTKKPKPKSQKAQKAVSLTGKVGTLKRKRELRELLDLHHNGHEDDFFDSTPMRKKTSKAPVSSMDDDDDIFGDKLPFDTPAATRTPYLKHFDPVSTRKTPHLSPVYAPIDRNEVDRYVNRLKKRRKATPEIKANKKNGKKSKLPEYGDDLFRRTDEVQDEDSEVESDFYWSDE